MFAQCSAFVSRQLFSARNVCSRAFPIPSTSFRRLAARSYSTTDYDLQSQTLNMINAQNDKDRQTLQTVEQMWASQSKAALAAAARNPPAGPYSGTCVSSGCKLDSDTALQVEVCQSEREMSRNPSVYLIRFCRRTESVKCFDSNRGTRSEERN
jgi:hypothetical protein